MNIHLSYVLQSYNHSTHSQFLFSLLYSLMTIDKKYVNQDILNKSNQYNLQFVESQILNEYAINKGYQKYNHIIYILNKGDNLNILKEKYGFTDYNC